MKETFLSQFAPLPEGVTLPERVVKEYEPESCLAPPEDGRLVLRLRRKADGALAVLKAAPADREDLAEEFRLLQKLAPLLPGQVPDAVDCFAENGTSYLLRAYLPGESLAQRREREDNCPEALCVSLGQKLCALLAVLHSQEPPVIHRDIKPENIVLLPDGEVGLIDFGIARQFKDGKDTDTRRMGSRSTAAPEQYGYAQTDARTDLYALGMSLIWLVTGRYDRDALAEAEGVSPHLRQVLEKATAFSPEDRYQDAAAFSAALSGGVSRKKRRWPAFIAAAVLLALSVGLGVLWPGAEPTSPEPTPEAPTPPEPQAVEFSSAVMEAAVRQALGMPEGEITYDDLSAVTRLAAVGETAFGEDREFDYRIACYIDNQYLGDAPLGDITDADLALLSHMPNLDELYLCRQEIRDLSALEGLPLTTLALCENSITDYAPLSTLTELETLYLGSNPGTDFSPLAALTRLTELTVEGSSTTGTGVVDSLSFLDSLTLRKLGLGLAEPKDGDWSPLSRQTALEDLRLWDPGEEAVAAANALTGLRTLLIGDYYAPDLTTLTGLVGLEVLNLHKGSLESLEGLQSLHRLYTLSVGFHPVTDLSPLAGLEQVNYVQLEGLAVTDFSALAALPALKTVVVPADQGPAVEAACPGHAFELRTY